jgi:hypothetical protein
MIKLEVTADTPAHLIKQLATLTGGFVAKISDEPEPIESQESQDDPYGDGNGPVDAVVPEPATTERLLDDRGVVWDERFHASTKKMTTAGAWKKRKGADGDELAAYENQFLNPTVPDSETWAPVTPQTDAAPTTPPPAPAPVMPQTEAAPAPSANVPSGPDVMAAASKLIQSGEKTPTYLSELCERAGLKNVGELFNDEAGRVRFIEELNKDGFTL